MTDFLQDVRRDTLARVVSFLEGVGRPVKNQYPSIEADTWTIQGPEAQRVVALGEAAVLTKTEEQLKELAPFLVMVCSAHYGQPESDTERAQQLWQKSLSVKANADVWLPIAAFVNGLRARVSDQIDAAADVADLYAIESAAQTEIAEFRAQFLPLQV